MSEMEARRAKRKTLWQLAYIFVTLLVLLLLGVFNPEIAPLFQGKLTLRSSWMLLCAAAMIGFWLLQTLVYHMAAKVVDVRIPLHRSLKVMMFGEYYSAVTPFASGGQPMQLGYYRRYGVSAAKGTSILALRYIGYLTAICLCFLVAFAAQGQRILAEHPVVFWLTALGFAVNLVSVLLVALLLFRRSMVERAGAWVIGLLCKLPWFKNRREQWLEKFARGADEFAQAAECIRQKPALCLALLLTSLLSVASQFSVAYFVYRSVGLDAAGYFELFSMQIYLYLAVSFVPTPGATGASEGGFYLFFAMLFPQSLLFSAMLLWRLFTYYSNLLIGAVLVVWDELRAMSKRKQKARAES